MKIRLFCGIVALLVTITAIGVQRPAKAQVAAGLTVGALMSEFESTAEGLIELGFDRLDRSIINFGVEMQVAAQNFRDNYEGALEKTVAELDGVQRKAMDDISSLVRTLEGAESGQLSDIVNAQEDAINSVYSLVSGTPLINRITQLGVVSADFSQTGESNIRIVSKGNALQSVEILDAQFLDKDVSDSVVASNNSELTFSLKLPEKIEDQYIDRGVARLPLKFSLEKCSFIFFCDTLTFHAEAIAFPIPFGKARVLYGGQVAGQARRTKQGGPYESARVQSRLRGFPPRIRAGERTDVWTARASNGWRIDVGTSRFIFQKLNGGCSNRRSTAAWVRRDSGILQVRATTGSDRQVGATCKTRTTIHYDEFQATRSNTTKFGDWEAIQQGENGIQITIPADHGLIGPRVASIEVQSPLFDDGTRVFAIGEDGSVVDNNTKLDINVIQADNIVLIKLVQ